MGYFAQKFKRMAFLLERILGGVGCAVYLEGLCLNFAGLAFAHRGYQTSGDAQGGAGGDRLQLLIGEHRHVKDYLYVLDCRAIIERHKLHVLIAATSTHPAFDTDVGVKEFGIEDVDDFCSFHCRVWFICSLEHYSKEPIFRKLTSCCVR